MNFVEQGKDHTPSITHLGVVSCEAYAQIPKERRIQSVRRGKE
jgi:predicted MarR family transcription regulator